MSTSSKLLSSVLESQLWKSNQRLVSTCLQRVTQVLLRRSLGDKTKPTTDRLLGRETIPDTFGEPDSISPQALPRRAWGSPKQGYFPSRPGFSLNRACMFHWPALLVGLYSGFQPALPTLQLCKAIFFFQMHLLTYISSCMSLGFDSNAPSNGSSRNLV